MPVRKIPKVWGQEVILNEGDYCCKLLQYFGPHTSSRHYHEEKHETFVILRGLFEIEMNALNPPGDVETHKMGPGGCLVLAPYTVHRVKCLSADGGAIVEASSFEDPDDCIRLTPSEAAK